MLRVECLYTSTVCSTCAFMPAIDKVTILPGKCAFMHVSMVVPPEELNEDSLCVCVCACVCVCVCNQKPLSTVNTITPCIVHTI